MWGRASRKPALNEVEGSERSEAPQWFWEGHGFSHAETEIDLDGFSR